MANSMKLPAPFRLYDGRWVRAWEPGDPVPVREPWPPAEPTPPMDMEPKNPDPGPPE